MKAKQTVLARGALGQQLTTVHAILGSGLWNMADYDGS